MFQSWGLGSVNKMLFANFKLDVVDIHGGNATIAVVVGSNMDLNRIPSNVIGQVEGHFSPGLAIAQPDVQGLDQIIILIEDQNILEVCR